MAKPTVLHAAALRLKYADPLAFNDFLRAAEAVELQALRDLQDAPAANILEVQGYSRGIKWLVTILRECAAMTS